MVDITRAQQIGQGLGAFGAGIQGNLPQFQQAQAQQQALQQQQQQQQQEMAQARQRAVFTDSEAALKLLNAGDFDSLVALGFNRLRDLRALGSEDPSGTQRLSRLALATRNGSEDAEKLLRSELETNVKMGKALGILTEPEPIKLGASQRLIDPTTGEEIVGVVEEEKDRKILKDSSGVSRFVDTGEVVFEGDVGIEADRETAKDVNGRLRFTDTQELVFPDVEAEEETGGFKATERLAAGFAQRTAESGAIITELGPEFTGVASRATGLVPRGLQSDDRQRFDQATRNFINATLRRESGAAIAPSEFASANLQYIPQPGDGQEVLAQKQRNRETISASLKLEAGDAFTQLEEILAPVDAIPKNLQTGQIVENSRGQRGIVQEDGSISIVEK